jgi:hypothetical protein
MNIYEKYFDGYDIYDCVVGGGNVALLGREENKPLSEIEKIKIVIDDNDKIIGENAGYVTLANIQDVKGCLATIPDPAYIFVSDNATVFKSGYEGDIEVQKYEQDIQEEGLLITDVIAIDGKAYALGSSREVYRRDDVDEWVNIAQELSDTLALELSQKWDSNKSEEERLSAVISTSSWMRGIAGFNENDIYIVGKNGECWQYNGKTWRRVDLPTNAMLTTVCCADDGYVYIGGIGEILLKGRDDKWEIVQDKHNENYINKIVDFQGKIYLSTFYNLFELYNNEIKEVDFGEYSVSDFGYLGVNRQKSKLVAGGSMAAYAYDGSKWIELINIFGGV